MLSHNSAYWKHILVSSKTAEYVHLQHIDVIAKCLQGHFKHDFLGQVAVPLKDHVAFN